MNQKITLTLPWPPTTNTAYATVNGRRVKSRAARAYTEIAARAAQLNYPKPPFTKKDRLIVSITLFPPDGRRFDIANREKVLLDAIAPVLGFDDAQIDMLTISRYPQADQPHKARAYVEIERYVTSST